MFSNDTLTRPWGQLDKDPNRRSWASACAAPKKNVVPSSKPWAKAPCNLPTAETPVAPTRLQSVAPSTIPVSKGVFAVWALYIFTTPFYLWRSGLPQVADFIMLTLFLITLGDSRLRPPQSIRSVFMLLGAFVAYNFAVNTGWSAVTNNQKHAPPIVYSFFYLYNALVFYIVVGLTAFEKKRFLKVTMFTVGGSLMFQAFASFAFPAATRYSGFFNNPNQIGYYALLSGTIFFLCLRTVRVGATFQMGVILAMLYLAGISLSKAAMLSCVVLVIIALAHQGLLNARTSIAFIMAAALIVSAGLTTNFGAGIKDKIEKRLSNLGQQEDDSMEARGYDRIFNHPKMLLAGAGEGAYHRFGKDKEMHSSFGTVLFSYGVPGFSLFLAFLFFAVRKSFLINVAYLLPTFAYGVTHMGVRDTFFWVILGLIATVGMSANVAKIRAPLNSKPWDSIKRFRPA